jgi:hypothetical protein
MESCLSQQEGSGVVEAWASQRDPSSGTKATDAEG